MQGIPYGPEWYRASVHWSNFQPPPSAGVSWCHDVAEGWHLVGATMELAVNAGEEAALTVSEVIAGSLLTAAGAAPSVKALL